MKAKRKKIFKKIITSLVLLALTSLFLLPIIPTAQAAPQNGGAWDPDTKKMDFSKLHHIHLDAFDPGGSNISKVALDGAPSGIFGDFKKPGGEVFLVLFKGNDSSNLNQALLVYKISYAANWFNLGKGLTNKWDSRGCGCGDKSQNGCPKCGGVFSDTMNTKAPNLEPSQPRYGIVNRLEHNSNDSQYYRKDINGNICEEFYNCLCENWNSDGKTLNTSSSATQGNDAYFLEPQPPGDYTIRAFGSEGDLPVAIDKSCIFSNTKININIDDSGNITITGPTVEGGSESIVDLDKEEQRKIKCEGPEKDENGNDVPGSKDYRGLDQNIKSDTVGFHMNVISEPNGWNLLEYMNPITLGLRIFTTIWGALMDLVLGIIKAYILQIFKDWGGGMLRSPSSLYDLPFVTAGWQLTRTLCNVFFVIAFFVILFLGLIGTYIDPYTIKKTLPRFVIAIIGVNLSLFICNELVVFSNRITSYFISGGGISKAGSNIVGNLVGSMYELGSNAAHNFSPSVGAVSIIAGMAGRFVEVIFLLFLLLAILFFFFVVIIRIVMIILLTFLSPFMFLSLSLPFGQGYVKSWWEKYIKWVFMAPIMALLIYLIYVLASTPANWDKLFITGG